jgi:hypothetical protein
MRWMPAQRAVQCLRLRCVCVAQGKHHRKAKKKAPEPPRLPVTVIVPEDLLAIRAINKSRSKVLFSALLEVMPWLNRRHWPWLRDSRDRELTVRAVLDACKGPFPHSWPTSFVATSSLLDGAVSDSDVWDTFLQDAMRGPRPERMCLDNVLVQVVSMDAEHSSEQGVANATNATPQTDADALVGDAVAAHRFSILDSVRHIERETWLDIAGVLVEDTLQELDVLRQGEDPRPGVGRNRAGKVTSRVAAVARLSELRTRCEQLVFALDAMWSLHAFNTVMALGATLGLVMPGLKVQACNMPVVCAVAAMASEAGNLDWEGDAVLDTMRQQQLAVTTSVDECLQSFVDSGVELTADLNTRLQEELAVAQAIQTKLDQNIADVAEAVGGISSGRTGLFAAYAESWHAETVRNMAVGAQVSNGMGVEVVVPCTAASPEGTGMGVETGAGVGLALWPVWVAYHRVVTDLTVATLQAMRATTRQAGEVFVAASSCLRRWQDAVRAAPPDVAVVPPFELPDLVPRVLSVAEVVNGVVRVMHRLNSAVLHWHKGLRGTVFLDEDVAYVARMAVTLAVPADAGTAWPNLQRFKETVNALQFLQGYWLVFNPEFVQLMTDQWRLMAQKCGQFVSGAPRTLLPAVVEGLGQVVGLFEYVSRDCGKCVWVPHVAQDMEMAVCVALKMMAVNAATPPPGVGAAWDSALSRVWETSRVALTAFHRLAGGGGGATMSGPDAGPGIGAPAGAGTGAAFAPGSQLMHTEAASCAFICLKNLRARIADAVTPGGGTGTGSPAYGKPLGEMVTAGIMALRTTIEAGTSLHRSSALLRHTEERMWEFLVPGLNRGVVTCTMSLYASVASLLLRRATSSGELNSSVGPQVWWVVMGAMRLLRAVEMLLHASGEEGGSSQETSGMFSEDRAMLVVSKARRDLLSAMSDTGPLSDWVVSHLQFLRTAQPLPVFPRAAV